MKNKKFTVDEAIQTFLRQLSERTGWKYLKSGKCVKKVIGKLVFEIRLYSSKWNLSKEKVEIQCECQMWSKDFDKTCNVKSGVGYYKIIISEDDWWDITTEERLSQVLEKVMDNLKESVLPLSDLFEDNFEKAAVLLGSKEYINKYRVKFKFIDLIAGREYITEVATDYYDSLPEAMKEDSIRYINGARDRSWMINPSNLRYIIDQKIISLDVE